MEDATLVYERYIVPLRTLHPGPYEPPTPPRHPGHGTSLARQCPIRLRIGVGVRVIVGMAVSD